MEFDTKNLPQSVKELEKIIVFLNQENQNHQDQIQKQQQEIASHQERYLRLLEAFKLEKSRRYTPSSEKNIHQYDLFDEPGIQPEGELKDQLDDTQDVASYQRKKHPGRRALPKDLPRETIVYDIPEDDKVCPCGAHLVRIGEEVSEQIKYIPAQLSIIQHVRPKYACKPCQENIKIAPMPHLLLPKSLATPELVAHTIIAKYCDHIPLYRQQGIWDRLGIDMPRNSLCGWLLKVSELCAPLVQLLQQNITTCDYVQADETTVQVLGEAGRSDQTKSYIWCYRGGGDKTSIVYDYQETRGGYHAEAFLEGFQGYLQSDAYIGYNFANDNEGIVRIGCMAHARRKFADIVKITKADGLAQAAIKHIKSLYKIEKEAKEGNLTPEARSAVRQKKAEPILAAFKQWLDCHLTKVPIQSQIGKAIQYTLTNWELLNNYLKDGRIEIDNNRIENAIRPFAVGRKNWRVPLARNQPLRKEVMETKAA